jgi:ABC-type branched-subunit amino acid transport system substrate-binding protein
LSRLSKRVAGALAAIVVMTTMLAVLPVTGGAADEKPADAEIGVTAKEIHLAVVADVDNAFAPGILKGQVDGVKAAAQYVNQQGGVAGRKLVIDFYDSKLNPTEARNGFIKACENDLAMAGTGTFLISSVDDIVSCKDKAGQATGIPDIPGVTTGTLEACSPVSFPLNGSQIDCSTATSSTPTYRMQAGDTQYLQKKYGPLKGPMIVSSDSAATQKSSTIIGVAAKQNGINITETIPMSSRDPQTAYTPVIQSLKTSGANFVDTGTPVEGVIAMRSEAELQGLTDPKFVWACLLNCYDQKLIGAGATVNNTRASIQFLPFEEAKSNTTLAAFMKRVPKDSQEGFAVWGWTATLAMAEVLKNVAADKGVNGITRANVLQGIKDFHNFNAGGMYATVDIGSKVPSPCFNMVVLNSGKYSREYPVKKATLDCKKSNLKTIQGS